MNDLINILTESKNPTNVIQYSTTHNSRNNGANIVRLSNGNLLLTWAYFKDDPEDGSSSEIWAKISSNNGITWRDGYRIIYSETATDMLGPSAIYKKANGDIVLIYLIWYNSVYAEIWKCVSNDNGATFSGNVKIYSSTDYEVGGDWYAPGTQRILTTQTGRLLYPFCVMTTAAHTSATAITVVRVLYSDNEGTDWTLSATVISAAGSGVEALLAEPVICQLPDATLLLASRTRSGYVRISSSVNNGLTWSNPPTKSGTLTTSNANIWMSYTNGKLIAIVNRPEGGVIEGVAARIHLDLWRSDDSGVTWSFIKNIVDNGGVNAFSDPTIFEWGSYFLVYYTSYPISDILQSLIFTRVNYNEF